MIELMDYNVREIDRLLEDVAISNNEGSEDKEWHKVVLAGYTEYQDRLVLVVVLEYYFNGDTSYDGIFITVDTEKSVIEEDDIDDGLGGGPYYQGGSTIEEMEEWLVQLKVRNIHKYEGIDENEVR